jgi:5-oxoprolinase (ATP-hydrolysing)
MWQFWLDIGGTFTDCLARRPDGTLLRRKVLSSAVTKGRAVVVGADTIIDPARVEPEGFWVGYTLQLLNDAGTVIGQSPVGLSVGGRLWLPSPLVACREGLHYELVSPEEAPILAIRHFLSLRLDQPLPPCTVRLGTTRGTNALLTRRGAKTGFVTTRGFADVLRIGYQNRPKLFELAIHKPEPLYANVAQIDERVAAHGGVLAAPHDEQIAAELSRLKAGGIESLAVCLLNSYANPRHEKQVERVALELGFTEISLSGRVSPLMKIVPRGDTTVVDAYLNPVLRRYVERLAAALPGSDVRLLTSAGGLASAANFTGKDSILSGPAGGVVGFSRVAQAAGFSRAIGFDMGGTSTDVSRYDGHYEYEYETQKAGVRIVAPMLAIETVAAGGGSICKFDGVKLVVGPESAGADPGPACYGRGGPLTITDCNLILGRILPEHFPFPLDRDAVEVRLAEIDNQMASEQSRPPTPSGPDTERALPSDADAGESQIPLQVSPSQREGTTLGPIALAAGFVRIANANMAQAIRTISIAKGYDPRDYILVAFGAAGPQHACAVASELGITRILSHPDAGVLSALGIGLADVVKHRTLGVYRLLDEGLDEVLRLFVELEQLARGDVASEGIAADCIQTRRSLDLRYQGTDATLGVGQPTDDDYTAAFAAEHRRRYGYVHENRPLEIVAARVEAIGRSAGALPPSKTVDPIACNPHGAHAIHDGGQTHDAALYHRNQLPAGAQITGPAIVVEPLTTTIIDPGWQATLLSGGELLLETIAQSPTLPLSSSPTPVTAAADPVLLEVFNNHFTAIATQMGITLRNTSMSVNVKERLDFSCAIFTADGDLVVNAPHIPVHLGAMGQTVKQIIADNPAMQPGDVFVTNDPYRGGSHLPDVTVVTPVFDAIPLPSGEGGVRSTPGEGHLASSAAQLLFFTASRAHHAEIGGITPGSMPPFSKNLAEEGVLIRNFKLLDAGVSRFAELRALLSSGPFPSRSPDTNLADITAQLAANHQGAEDLRRMIEQHSLPVVQAYMRHIQDAAERKMRQALAKLPPGRREFIDHLDDGTSICVAVTIAGDSATIDFTGTGPVSAGNLNANRAIVTAAVMYVLRLLIGEDIPLNQGVLAPIEIILPECLLNPQPLAPSPSLQPSLLPAVVGGNVETSQRVVDCLLGAFGLAAASQGTMNNLLFGDANFGYYETICGGSGATSDADGADAVHTHMTNTRLTDPEVLEARYPVRLREFSIRHGSGGAGAHRGGDGVIRRLEFLRPLTLSILSQRRGPYPPYGASGGQPGSLGRNTLQRADGQIAELAALVQTEVQPGDILTIETPGGGGWGAARP